MLWVQDQVRNLQADSEETLLNSPGTHVEVCWYASPPINPESRLGGLGPERVKRRGGGECIIIGSDPTHCGVQNEEQLFDLYLG